jgi:hypothetical protein
MHNTSIVLPDVLSFAILLRVLHYSYISLPTNREHHLSDKTFKAMFRDVDFSVPISARLTLF